MSRLEPRGTNVSPVLRSKSSRPPSRERTPIQWGFVPAAPDVKGVAALRETISGMMKDPNFALSFETTAVEAARSSDLAYEVSTYSITVSDPKTKKPVTQKGNGVAVWKKAL